MIYRNKWTKETLTGENLLAYHVLIHQKLIKNHKVVYDSSHNNIIVEYESDLTVDELKSYLRR